MKKGKIELIKKEFYLQGLLQKTCFFEMYTHENNKFFYTLVDGETTHNLQIVAERTSFLNKEKVVDLLDLDNLLQLRHEIFIKEAGKSVYLTGMEYIKSEYE